MSDLETNTLVLDYRSKITEFNDLLGRGWNCCANRYSKVNWFGIAIFKYEELNSLSCKNANKRDVRNVAFVNKQYESILSKNYKIHQEAKVLFTNSFDVGFAIKLKKEYIRMQNKLVEEKSRYRVPSKSLSENEKELDLLSERIQSINITIDLISSKITNLKTKNINHYG